MTGEPSATGKPIYVFSPGGNGSAKFNRFHDCLRTAGVTRPMPARFERVETWTYQPINTAEAIAAEITKRWAQRRTMLGNGTRG
jgi:mitochondrial fission protein ELM1